MRKLLYSIPLIFVVFLAGCTSYSSTPSNSASNNNNAAAPVGVVHEIDMTSSGFSPDTVTVHLGDTVVFVNKDTAPHWPAGDNHPTHCLYKGCGVFDAHKDLNQGENYSIVFDIAGTWGFHDHLHASRTGSVTVQ